MTVVRGCKGGLWTLSGWEKSFTIIMINVTLSILLIAIVMSLLSLSRTTVNFDFDINRINAIARIVENK